MNKLPKLTEEERNAALERAMQVRRERAMLKSRFKSGTVSVEEAMGEDCAQKMRVTQFIKSIPGVGDANAKDIKTLLLTDRLFGRVTNAIWNRYDDDGKNQWVGKHMMLYKHNDPPKEGDRSKNGYRRVVYAEPLD